MRALMIALMLTAFVLGGCAMFQADRPVLQVDYANAFLVYADTKAAYSVAKVRIVDACQAKILAPETCTALQTADDRIQLTDQFIRSGLANPISPIDWQKVQMFTSEVLGVLVKVGVRGLVMGATP